MKIRKLIRSLKLLLIVFLVVFSQQNLQFAQQSTENFKSFRSLQGEELSDTVVFEHLFKMINSHIKEADEQEKLGFPQRADTLRTYFQRKAQLTDEQSQRLNEIVGNFQQEVAALKEQKGQVEISLKEQADEVKLLIEIKNLYEKRAQLWLKYRDFLRDTFGSEKFERFRQFLQENIAAKIKRNPIAVRQHPRFTTQKSSNSFEMLIFYNYSYSDVDYNSNSNAVVGKSITWIDGGSSGLYFSEFSSTAVCDPENNYCWNVSIDARMDEPELRGTPQTGEDCEGYIEAYFYPVNPIESGEYWVYGDHAGQRNIGGNPNCSMQGADIYDFTDDYVTVIVPKVDILLNGEVITNTTQNVNVGQQINLSTQVTGGTSTNPQWTIPGEKVANYVITYTNPTSKTSAEVTNLTSQNLTQSTVKFYWVDGADSRQVQYSVKVNNRTYTATATFNVSAPTVSITPEHGLVFLFYSRLGNIDLTCGDPSLPGVKFVPTPYPASGFQLQWVQTYSILHRKQLNNGTWQRIQGIGLDVTYPYPFTNAQIGSLEDSPRQGLSDNEKRVIVQDSVKTWLMAKPNQTNSIWVPVKLVEWSWQGDVSRTRQWSFNSRTAPDPSVSSTIAFPLWNQNIQRIINAGFVNE